MAGGDQESVHAVTSRPVCVYFSVTGSWYWVQCSTGFGCVSCPPEPEYSAVNSRVFQSKVTHSHIIIIIVRLTRSVDMGVWWNYTWHIGDCFNTEGVILTPALLCWKESGISHTAACAWFLFVPRWCEAVKFIFPKYFCKLSLIRLGDRR